MPTTSFYKILSRVLFFAGVFFITLLFADWPSGPFFLNSSYRVLKLILCVIVPAGTTVFNYQQEKSLNFIGKSMIIIMSFFVIGFFVCNLLRMSAFMLNEIGSLYHIIYALICDFTVFTSATIISLKEKNKKTDYESFYNSFFLGYLPMLITLYALLYINYRSFDAQYVVNFVPFRGEIKNLLTDITPFGIMRSVGNVAYYATLALTAARFTKKHRAAVAFIIPFALCILTEAAQGIFNIGDADIDDIILNSLGALIGALIYKFVIEKARRNSLCSE